MKLIHVLTAGWLVGVDQIFQKVQVHLAAVAVPWPRRGRASPLRATFAALRQRRTVNVIASLRH